MSQTLKGSDYINMENRTTAHNIPKLEEITQVYKHRKNKTGGCRCGCLGTYWSKDGSPKNDRKIKKIYNIISAVVTEAAEYNEFQGITFDNGYIDVWMGDRFLTMYFKRNVSQT